MSKRRLDKKIMLLEPVFKDILVCKSKDSRPYIEIFVEEPENVFQQNLGTLFGVLEINDDSEDSSYVVNYLISIIKKEYFSNTKRGPVESFEAALHKANLALAKLAEHNNVSWLGNLNAVCAVSEKNNIHLSQTGTASAFLVRSRTLASIIERDLDSNEELNPLKTFQEVVSGRLENQDKIILTTDSIFNIFSLEEIKKSALKFSREEFQRFLHTALVNELEKAAVLIIDVKEKEEPESVDTPKRARKINAFSQQTFVRKPGEPEPGQEERKELIEELKKELEKTQDGFVDEKTGHIYIKDEEYPIARPSGESYIKNVYEKLSASGGGIAHSVKEKTKAQIASLTMPKPRESLLNLKNKFSRLAENTRTSSNVIKPKEEWDIIPKSKALAISLGQKSSALFATIAFYSKSFFNHRIIPAGKGSIRWLSSLFSAISLWIANRYREYQSKKEAAPQKIEVTQEARDYAVNPETMASTREEKKEWFNKLAGRQNNFSSPAYQPTFQPKVVDASEYIPRNNFLPSFSRLKNILRKLDRRKRILALSVVVLLVVGPYLAIKVLDSIGNKKTSTMATVAPQPETALPLMNDKNVVRIASMDSFAPDIVSPKLVNVNGKIWAVDKSNIYLPEENKSYPLPEDFQNPELVFEMDDLNLIHIEKNGQILSFSVNARKFQNNKINLPDTHSLPAAKSYLTYAYFLDPQADQVYRYPRAEGGFGDKTDWLKDSADLSGFKDMAVSGDVFLTDGKTIIKFTRGKKQDFSLESTATPISLDKIYTKPDKENLYILDKTNSRIVKVGPGGNIISQYYHDDIKNSQDFSVNEESGKVYISSDKGVEEFNI